MQSKQACSLTTAQAAEQAWTAEGTRRHGKARSGRADERAAARTGKHGCSGGPARGGTVGLLAWRERAEHPAAWRDAGDRGRLDLGLPNGIFTKSYASFLVSTSFLLQETVSFFFTLSLQLIS